MEAVLRGAAEAGAHTIGYTCATFEASSEPNGWVKEERKTPTLTARIQRMADESDALNIVQKRHVGRAGAGVEHDLWRMRPGQGPSSSSVRNGCR